MALACQQNSYLTEVVIFGIVERYFLSFIL